MLISPVLFVFRTIPARRSQSVVPESPFEKTPRRLTGLSLEAARRARLPRSSPRSVGHRGLPRRRADLARRRDHRVRRQLPRPDQCRGHHRRGDPLSPSARSSVSGSAARPGRRAAARCAPPGVPPRARRSPGAGSIRDRYGPARSGSRSAKVRWRHGALLTQVTARGRESRALSRTVRGHFAELDGRWNAPVSSVRGRSTRKGWLIRRWGLRTGPKPSMR